MRSSHLFSAALALFTLAACSSAQAEPPNAETARVPRPDPVQPEPVRASAQVTLLSGRDAPLPTYYQNGKTYVLGELGERYSIRVTNPTPHRVEAVVSVDGLDVIDGKAASLSKRGYILQPYGSVTIEGFRTSMDNVATFRFSSVDDSYAARTGSAKNVGVIGVALFAELRPEPPPPVALPRRPTRDREHRNEGEPRQPAPPAPRRKAAASESARAPAPTGRPGLGTEFGEQRQSSISYTSFDRASQTPMSVREIRYDNRAGLLARGIRLTPPRPVYPTEQQLRDQADPFPSDGFAKPPPPRSR